MIGETRMTGEESRWRMRDPDSNLNLLNITSAVWILLVIKLAIDVIFERYSDWLLWNVLIILTILLGLLITVRVGKGSEPNDK